MPPADRPAFLGPEGVALLDVFALERVDRDLFRSTALFEERWSLFGGQVAAQALLAAGRTVDAARRPHSLHGYFLRPGDSRRPVVFSVERDRDGRSFSARRVVALQEGEVILNLSASFHADDDDAEDEVALTRPQAVATEVTIPHRLIGFEQRVVDLPYTAHPTQVWMRCTEDLPDDPLVHAAALTYLSDIYTGHGALASAVGKHQSTLDHTVWFHRPARADEWVLMDLQPRSVGRGRGLYTGALWTEPGGLVASLAQETLYRSEKR